MAIIIMALVLTICAIAVVQYIFRDHSEPKYGIGYVPSILPYLEKLEEMYLKNLYNKEAEVGDSAEISDETVTNYYN